jgi:formate dehydrogenase alpha subunit
MTFKITIDGVEIEADESQTILDVARDNCIYIPTLCSHPHLSNVGACRVCLVEVKGAPTLSASCCTPVAKDMVINTNSERAVSARKLVVELLLASHKIDCLTCESNGDCKLQKLAYDMGIERDKIRFGIQASEKPLDDSSPVIIRDYSKCILCGRCVRACQEVTLKGVLGFVDRGHEMTVAAGLDQPLKETDCASCGACVQVCPVGALVDKMTRFRGRVWELSKTATICPYCGVGCSMNLYTKDNKVIKVAGNEDGPENKGLLCVKGRYGYDFINSKDRLATPLIKRNGKFEPATWDEALDLVITKFMELKERYGGDSLAGLASAKCSNEENYLFQKLVRTCFGTNNIDHCARLCHSSTLTGLVQAFGSGAMTNSIREVLDADAILVTGSNTTENHPVLGFFIKQAVQFNGAKLIVVDPRKIELAEKWASLWLRPRSGTDVAWINGMMNVILNEDLQDQSFIESRCENFEELKRAVAEYTPQRVQEITGIPTEDLIQAARIYAKSPKSMIFYSMGITQHTTGVDNVESIANLAMLAGKIGKESTGVNPLRGQNSVQGSCDMGALPEYYSGYQKVTQDQMREKMEKAWGATLNPKEGLAVTEMMPAVLNGKIKGMYIMGEDPMMTDPNLNHVREAFEKLDFLVVQDLFMTETAELADVVLPGASFAEKDGTFTNTDRRIQRVRKAIEPIAGSLPDWKILVRLANKMGQKFVYNDPSDIMDEIARVTPIYGGISYSRLDRGGIQWPCSDRTHLGTKILHVNGFSRGKGHFTAVQYKPAAELPDLEYPYLLSTGRILYHYHSGSMTRRSKGLNALAPECLIEMNPRDTEKLGLVDGDRVKVCSRRGEIEAKLKVTDRSAPGMVFIPFHFREAAANLLTNDALDRQAKIPEYKVAAVRVAKAYP